MRITSELLKLKAIEFEKKLNGFCRYERSRILLLINKDLSDEEFVLYCIFDDVISDWDNGHDKFGSFEVIPDLFAEFIGWTPSKIRRILKSLITKGFIAFLGMNMYVMVGVELKKHKRVRDVPFDYYAELKKLVETHLIKSSTNHNDDAKSNPLN